MALAPGSRIGSYEILAPLGSGGMGEVYRAHDPKLHRDVAIKILLESFSSDPERRQRFEREAQTIAALNHPGIVTIYSVESAGDVLFLTMELVEGKPLSDLIPKDGAAFAQILKWMIPLADAVSAAHQRGITHRDLKPANVMVTVDGRVKVLDFGLAKLKEQESGDAGALPTQALTGEGRIVGTVAYMSPEQAEGKPIDHRTDIFSLGILLYELATGQRPFRGDTSASVMASILKDSPVSIADVKTGVPRELARIAKRCLVKDPEHRYQTAKDLRNELEALKEEVDSGVSDAAVPASAPVRTTRRPLVLAAAAIGVVAAVALAGWMLLKGRPPAATTSVRAFDSVKLTRLTNTGSATLAAISPDGKYVVHVVVDAGQQSLWMRQVATSSNVQIVAPADQRFDGVAFSPDGNYVYYSTYPGSGGGNVAWLQQIPILGGTPRRILEDIDSPVSFSPDGKRFAFLKGFQTAGETAIMIANIDGTGLKRIAARKNPDNYPLSDLAWSPDGHAIAVPVNVDSSGQRSVRIAAIDPDAGTETMIGSRRWEFVGSVAWVDRGRGLAIAAAEAGGSTQLWYQPFPDGEPRRITNDLNGYDQVSVTSDSSALVAVQGDSQSHLWVLPAGDVSRAVEITAGTGRFDASPAWTPDGRIVYQSNASGNGDVWIVDADGRNARQLTIDPGIDSGPVVSADGKTIVFQSARSVGSSNGVRIWKMDADGGRQVPLTSAPGSLAPLITPDSQWVYYTSVAEAQRSLWKIPLAGGDPVAVPVGAASGDEQFQRTVSATFIGRAISIDGQLVAGSYLDREARAFRVGVVSLSTGQLVKTFEIRTGISRPQFTPDGRALTFADTRDGIWNIFRQALDGGAAKPVTTFTSGWIFDAAWSRDGKQLAIARGSVTSDAVLISNLAPAAGKGTP